MSSGFWLTVYVLLAILMLWLFWIGAEHVWSWATQAWCFVNDCWRSRGINGAPI